MPYDVRLMDERPVIAAVFSGSVTIPERFDAMQAIVRCSAKTGVLRLLLDFRQACAEANSQAETVAYAERLAGERAMRKMTIAYVGSPEQTAGVETLAALRGYFYQRFPDEESALRWLR
jgi:hypothetical protein